MSLRCFQKQPAERRSHLRNRSKQTKQLYLCNILQHRDKEECRELWHFEHTFVLSVISADAAHTPYCILLTLPLEISSTVSKACRGTEQKDTKFRKRSPRGERAGCETSFLQSEEGLSEQRQQHTLCTLCMRHENQWRRPTWQPPRRRICKQRLNVKALRDVGSWSEMFAQQGAKLHVITEPSEKVNRRRQSRAP